MIQITDNPLDILRQMEVGNERLIAHGTLACSGQSSHCTLATYAQRMRLKKGWRLTVKHLEVGLALVTRWE